MNRIETIRSPEEVRVRIDEIVMQFEKDLKNAGDPTVGNDWRELAIAKHLPKYAELVFELAQCIGKEQALKETGTKHVRIFHRFRSGTISKIEDLYLNQQNLFVETLMDIALSNHGSEVNSQPIDSRVNTIQSRTARACFPRETPES